MDTVDSGRASATSGVPTGLDRWLVPARWAWRVAASAVLLMFLAGLPARYEQLSTLTFASYSRADILRSSNPEEIGLALSSLGLSPSFYASYSIVLEVLFGLVFCTIAVMILRQPSHPWQSMLVSLILVLFGLTAVPTIHALATVRPEFQLPVRFVNALAWTLFGVFYYLFPDGRFTPRKTWLLAVVWVVWQTSWSISPELPWNPLNWPPSTALLVWVGWFATGVAAQVYRYLRVSTPAQRQQTKWVVFGLTVAVAGAFLVNTFGVMSTPQPGTSAAAFYELARTPLTYLFVLLVPVFMGISIFRYRLWEIDLLINRTLVYVPLTAIVAGMYTTSITLSQRLFVAITGERSDTAIVITTLIVASTFTPIKNGLQGIVDRRFKEVPDPTKRLQAFGSQVRAVVQIIDVRQVTRRILDEAVAAFDAECGVVRLAEGARDSLLHTLGQWEECNTIVTVPIQVDGVTLGTVSLGPRGDGAAYTEHDLRALESALEPVARAILLMRRAA